MIKYHIISKKGQTKLIINGLKGRITFFNNSKSGKTAASCDHQMLFNGIANQECMHNRSYIETTDRDIVIRSISDYVNVPMWVIVRDLVLAGLE